MNATQTTLSNGTLIRYRTETSPTGTRSARIDLKTRNLTIEYGTDGKAEWYPVREDGVRSPFMVHVDDIAQTWE